MAKQKKNIEDLILRIEKLEMENDYLKSRIDMMPRESENVFKTISKYIEEVAEDNLTYVECKCINRMDHKNGYYHIELSIEPKM